MKEIPISGGKCAVVDDSDYARLSLFRWQLFRDKRTMYARRRTSVNGKKTSVWMHREILGEIDPGLVVDHMDGDGLNNTRSNLRTCTNQQNMFNAPAWSNNSSGMRGVYRHGEKWRARVSVGGKRIDLGVFDSFELAANARTSAELRLFGDFRRGNIHIDCGKA